MKTGRAKYVAPGPKPTTERGHRRHNRRSDAEKKHATSVWVNRQDWISLQAFTPSGHLFGAAKL